MWVVGTAIKELREANNLSRKELAARLNVTPRAIGNWENGDREPSLEVISKLSLIFNTSIDYLLTGKITVENNGNEIHLKFKSGNKTCFDINMIQDFISKLEENKIDAEALVQELNKK